jgi:parallel beta-helix repeat protein
MRKLNNCLLILLPILLLVAGSAFADPKKTGPNHGAPKNVTECGTFLTEPGNYKLVHDLLDCSDDGGVWIVGSDITLNLKGHEISCLDGWVGIFLAGSEEATVKNITVKNGHVSNCVEGIALWLAEDSKVMNMTSTGNWGAGIAVWESSNNVFMHNYVHGNATDGILSWQSSGNLFKHNTSTDNGGALPGEGAGISLDGETNSRIMCNRVHGNVDGILMFPGGSGNLLRGNLITGNLGGIGMLGIAEDGAFLQNIPAGNTVRSNIVEDNVNFDFFEFYYDRVTGDLLIHPEDLCMNTWEKNQFRTELGPPGCFGIPVELDDHDVCALDYDD